MNNNRTHQSSQQNNNQNSEKEKTGNVPNHKDLPASDEHSSKRTDQNKRQQKFK
ncbi:hypothetical protein BH10PSE19_BH10PSE19_18840 [soil metagenome]